MRTSSIALAVAVLWIVALLSLFIALSGSEQFAIITLSTSILVGIGMFVLAWNVSSPPGEGRRIVKLFIGLVGSTVYAAVNALILVGFRDSDELEAWMIAGLAVYGLWMILDSATPGVGTGGASRRLEAAVGIGFVLLFVSVLFLGTVGATPQAGQPVDMLMIIVQGVGGIAAYFGFPVWLYLLARRTREAKL